MPDGVARRGSILLVHGLGEHSGRYGHVAGRLAALGLEVCGYDLRGHGRSEGPRGSIPHSDALLEDLRHVFDELDRRGRAAGDEAPPLLLGHSLGGTIAAAGDRRRVGRAARAGPVVAGARPARQRDPGRRC